MKNCNIFNKKQIALVIRNSTLCNEQGCYLRNKCIIESCEKFRLKRICARVGKVSDEYIENTSTVVNRFNFQLKRNLSINIAPEENLRRYFGYKSLY